MLLLLVVVVVVVMMMMMSFWIDKESHACLYRCHEAVASKVVRDP